MTTLIVNLFAGPGAGKSTLMAGIFADLKHQGVCAEMAPEFAKELCWEGRRDAMQCQPYVFGEQLYRIQRLAQAGVEVVVTDSPLLLSVVYGQAMPKSFRDAVLAISRSFDNLDVMIHRTKPYDQRGREQTLPEAVALDERIEDMLRKRPERTLHVLGADASARSAAVDEVHHWLRLGGARP